MSRRAPRYECHACGSPSATWSGRCGACGEWNTITEMPTAPAGRSRAAAAGPTQPPRPITEIAEEALPLWATGIGELDRVLGGGLVPGSVSVVGGEPGIGKSTFLLQVAASLAVGARRTVLYVSAEESIRQVRDRAERLGCLADQLLLASETDLGSVIGAIDHADPAFVVLDSIQTVHDAETAGVPGSVTQVREAANRLVEIAKRSGRALVLVGHVTKDGSLAGPRQLEHVVDTVLAFEGDRDHSLRMIRAQKHRFGSTAELGLFEMTGRGLVGVPDPSGLFLADRQAGVPGSTVAATVDGNRPLLVEIQALVTKSSLNSPRRSVSGLDPTRVGQLLAVLATRAGIDVSQADVYASAAGGIRVNEPGADVAVALSIASAMTDRAVPAGVVAIGEIGLSGEIRSLPRLDRRLAEAARLGFDRALVPAGARIESPPLPIDRVATLVEALEASGIRRTGGPRRVA